MKRAALVAVIAAAVLITPMTAEAKPGDWTRGPCNGWYSQPRPSDPNVDQQVTALITCAERAFPVAAGLGTVLGIAERESGLGPWSVNPTSGACGVFQSIPSLWPGRAASLPHAWFAEYLHPLSCLYARANVLWAVRSMHFGGLGPWGG